MAIAPAHTDLLALYEQMLLIRVFETEAERQYKAAQIGGYCHLSSGQEATCVGVVHAMQDDDLLVTGYRSHGFALARGTSPEAVMAELFGKRDGCAHGRGGSMHLLDTERGYYGGWGIVGGQLPLATGLALALVRQGKQQAVVCELGDGAVNMGAWHESLNLAALWKLPIVFLVVNNKYGMGTAVDRASAEPDLYKRASAYRMHGEPVDGDDLEAVIEASARLLERAREEREPAVLEAITYRYRGHSVADAGLAYRTKDEIARAPAEGPAAARRVAAARGRRHHGRAARDRRARRGARAAGGGVRARQPGAGRRRARLGDARARARTSSSRACGRGARSAKRSSSSTRGWASEHRDRDRGRAPQSGTERMTYREALRLALREELARDERVFIMGEEVGVFEGSYKVTAGLMAEFGARPRARHADLRGGLRRRRRRRGDAGRAPGRRDHDAELPARRDGPGDQPRGEDRRDVRRRGALPAGDPHAQRRGQPAHRAALAVLRRLVRRHARPEGRDARQLRPTPRAC